jgi:hypothetical protein
LPIKDDLWEALSEYPDAKKLLLEKGREILKKEEQPSLNIKEQMCLVVQLSAISRHYIAKIEVISEGWERLLRTDLSFE